MSTRDGSARSDRARSVSRIAWAGVLATLMLAAAQEAPEGLETASWIWEVDVPASCHLRRKLVLAGAPASAELLIAADNGYRLWVNGAFVGESPSTAADGWRSAHRYDVSRSFAPGPNVIGIRADNAGGPAGVLFALRLSHADGNVDTLVSDEAWQASPAPEPPGFSHPDYVEGADWRPAKVLGRMGVAPWGRVSTRRASGHSGPKAAPTRLPGPGFVTPREVAFVADDLSVYVPRRADAWGVCFRVGTWSRAYTEFDLPSPSKIGRTLRAWRPGEGESRVLLEAGPGGALGSPAVSFDGTRIYIALAPAGEKFFHLYSLPAGGGAPRRLTDGPFHDIDPAELPDGRIVFASTRIGTFEEYHQPPSRALFVMNPDGSGIRPLTFTPSFDNEPKVTADGQIAFIRTDNFFDRSKVETRIHLMRPDGTSGSTALGAESGPEYGDRLRAFGYGSPAPLPDGRLAAISTRGNVLGRPGEPDARLERLPPGLGDLAPLPDGRLLCTVLRSAPDGQVSDLLGVLDPRDSTITTLIETPGRSLHSPVFLGPRERPPILPDTVDPRRVCSPDATGFLLCQDLRSTMKSGADFSRIRAVRVLAGLGLTTRSSHSHIVHVGNETVELGVAPLAPDGSLHVEVPADVPLALQAVDAEGRSELNEMSWIYVRPGERVSCVGCHSPRQAAPALSRAAQAFGVEPLRLLGQGRPHRFRGNSAAVNGMMDLQFERFREVASMNRFGEDAIGGRQEERASLLSSVRGGDAEVRVSAVHRLGLLRDRRFAPALGERLQDTSREVRTAAALALGACGTRESLVPLAAALEDEDPWVRQAAGVALEGLTGFPHPFDAFGPSADRRLHAADWGRRLRPDSLDDLERRLVAQLSSSQPDAVRRAVVALGHIGETEGRRALREWLDREARRNPYPPFLRDNRTDRFTFSAYSPFDPRTLQAAARGLGHLGDAEAVPLLSRVLLANLDPETSNLFLAEATAEALGRVGDPGARTALLSALDRIGEYWRFAGWYGDHPALYACHASPVHARLAEALDAADADGLDSRIPTLLRSIPTDPDRALLLEIDAYEALIGRLVRRSGREAATVEACLFLLGDEEARPDADLLEALRRTHPAWAGHPGPEIRAAQVLSIVARDLRWAARVRMAFERFRNRPEEAVRRRLENPASIPLRHWTLFYLARTLGALGDRSTADVLRAALDPRLHEARLGRPDPGSPEIHFLQVDYTPCWRAAAASALGRIGDRRDVTLLLAAASDMNNATDVRHAAADAIGRIGSKEDVAPLRERASTHPEVSTRRALLRSAAFLAGAAAYPGRR